MKGCGEEWGEVRVFGSLSFSFFWLISKVKVTFLYGHLLASDILSTWDSLSCLVYNLRKMLWCVWLPVLNCGILNKSPCLFCSKFLLIPREWSSVDSAIQSVVFDCLIHPRRQMCECAGLSGVGS